MEPSDLKLFVEVDRTPVGAGDEFLSGRQVHEGLEDGDQGLGWFQVACVDHEGLFKIGMGSSPGKRGGWSGGGGGRLALAMKGDFPIAGRSGLAPVGEALAAKDGLEGEGFEGGHHAQVLVGSQLGDLFHDAVERVPALADIIPDIEGNGRCFHLGTTMRRGGGFVLDLGQREILISRFLRTEGLVKLAV
jgi:hypothetical protein